MDYVHLDLAVGAGLGLLGRSPGRASILGQHHRAGEGGYCRPHQNLGKNSLH